MDGRFLLLLIEVALMIGVLFQKLLIFEIGSLAGSTDTNEHSGSAEKNAKERYAKGEIGRKEYQRIMDDLS